MNAEPEIVRATRTAHGYLASRAALRGWDTRRLNQSGYGHPWRLASMQESGLISCIYLVTNLSNGKRYVGKTRYTAEYRWAQHTQAARSGSKDALHRAIRKYGLSNFKVKQIWNGPTETASAAEMRCISKFKTLAPVGYNLTFGGDGVMLTPASIKKISRTLKAYCADPAVRCQLSLQSRQAWQSGVMRANQQSINGRLIRTKEDSRRHSEAIKRGMRKSGARAKIVTAQKRLWQTSTYRTNQVIAIRKGSGAPEARAKNSAAKKCSAKIWWAKQTAEDRRLHGIKCQAGRRKKGAVCTNQ